MTLREIRSKICFLRSQVEELAEAAREIWLADGPDADEADDLEGQLEEIAAALSEEENE